jgi:drug/metabolite transporter (DMT)-like permease
MFDPSWLWAVFTIVAAAAQTVRNAAQRELTTRLGTVGATHVRFLFGFPFALIFLAGVMIALGQGLPRPPPAFWPWVVLGALTQVAATALMLAAMNDRRSSWSMPTSRPSRCRRRCSASIFLGDVVTPGMAAAILIATSGVVTMALKPGTSMDVRATLLGLAAGAMFALSAVGFRGAILSLGLPSYVMAATFTLVVGLVMQSALLSLFLWLRNPDVLVSIMRAWRTVPVRGIHGRAGVSSSGSSRLRSPPLRAYGRWRWSRCCSRKQSRVSRSSRPRTPREAVGVVLIVVGVLLLLWTG